MLGERSSEDTVIVFLNVEATSTDPRHARVIELGMSRCRYGPGMRLVEVEDTFVGLDDPGVDIPKEVVALTGITDDMVRGKRLDPETVQRWLGEDPLIVAHNAGFDRPIFERRFPSMSNYRWGCSYKGVPWSGMGYRSASLPMLLEQEGWFFDAHRANADCLAVSWLLHLVPGALDSLMESTKDAMMITAAGNTYPIKERLKERGYNFNGKNWVLIVSKDSLDQEMAFLEAVNRGNVNATCRRVTARTAFK